MPDKRRSAGQTLSWHDLLSELMAAVLFAATIMVPVERLVPDYRISIYGLLGLGLAGAYLMRIFCTRIWQYILISLALVALPLVSPILPPLTENFLPRLIAVPAMLYLAVRTFYLRLMQKQEKQISDPIRQAFVLVYLLAVSLIAVRLGLIVVSQAIFYLGVVYLMLALVRWHRMALMGHLERFLRMPTQPAARIRQFNRMLLAGYALFTLVLLLVSPWLHLHDLLPWLGTALLAGLRWLLQRLTSGEPEPTEPPVQPTPQPSDIDPNLPFEPGETAKWLVILQEIFFYLMVIIAIAIIVALIGYTIYRLYKRFYESSQPDTDETESLLPAFVEQTRERLRRARNRLGIHFGQTPDQKIRRLFYQLVQSQKDRGLVVDECRTAREIIGQLDAGRHPELAEIISTYEKARYGPGLCTADDAGSMQAWCKPLRRVDLRLPPDPSRPGIRKGNDL